MTVEHSVQANARAGEVVDNEVVLDDVGLATKDANT